MLQRYTLAFPLLFNCVDYSASGTADTRACADTDAFPKSSKELRFRFAARYPRRSESHPKAAVVGAIKRSETPRLRSLILGLTKPPLTYWSVIEGTAASAGSEEHFRFADFADISCGCFGALWNFGFRQKLPILNLSISQADSAQYTRKVCSTRARTIRVNAVSSRGAEISPNPLDEILISLQ